MRRNREFEHLLEPLLSRSSVDEIVPSLAKLRSANEGCSEAIDRHLTAKILANREAIEELRERHKESRRRINELTEPPLHRAMLLEMRDFNPPHRALVLHGGSQRVVTVNADVSPEDLVPGREVFLSPQGNTILECSSRNCVNGGEIAVVERRLDRDRLVLREQGSDIVVKTTPALFDIELSAGDRVLWDRGSNMALEVIPANDHSPHFIEDISETCAQQVAGLGEQHEKIISRFTLGHVHPQIAAEYGVDGRTSLLLYGPPGCGKTSTMRLVAHKLSEVSGETCRVASVNAANLESPWVGETQSNIRQLFDTLRRHPGPKALLIDEVEAIGRNRGSTAGVHNDKFLSTWLTEIDGFRNRDGIAVIGSTNRKDLLDPALLDRLSAMECYIGRPKLAAAREIFAVHLPETFPYKANGAGGRSVRHQIIDKAVDLLYSPNADNEIATLRFRDGKARTLAARELVSGRLISQVARAARDYAFLRHASGEQPGISIGDITEAVSEAIERIASTLTIRNAHAYLSDLPQDVDIVAVEPYRRKVRRSLIVGDGDGHD